MTEPTFTAPGYHRLLLSAKHRRGSPVIEATILLLVVYMIIEAAKR